MRDFYINRLDVTRKLITAALLLCAKICLGSSSIEAKMYWWSPDGAIEILLHDKWKQTEIAKSKQYDSNLTSQVIPGSFHTLHVGGILPPRYISLSVYLFSNAESNKVEELINLVSQQLRGKNLDVVDVHFDKQVKGYIHYRFTHTGYPVSQVLIFVGVSTGIYAIEVNAPRQDEEKLKYEAQRIFNNISILKPYKKK